MVTPDQHDSTPDLAAPFDAEAWMETIAPRVRALARPKLCACGVRGTILEEAADDIVQLIATKAMNVPALRQPGAYLATAARNQAVDWVRVNRDVYASSLIEESADDGDEYIVRTPGQPVCPSAEDDAFASSASPDLLVARLEDVFRHGARRQVARLIHEDAAFQRRLRKSSASRGMLFTILRRPNLLATLLQARGRDRDGAATAEADDLAGRLGADVRTLRNRRSDWLRYLRDFFAQDLALYHRAVVRLYPNHRATE
jgi:DNA-directed RNA polymerase specialized sigma24 family protein